MNPERRLDLASQLSGLCSGLPTHYRNLCEYVIGNDRFQVCNASKGNHHTYAGGLMEHTLEVIHMGLAIMGEDINSRNYHHFMVAAIWHDFHKIYEYRTVPTPNFSGPVGSGVFAVEYEYTPYRDLIGHITGAYQEFMAITSMKPGSPMHIRDAADQVAIGHAILAHHGRKEWGSPVEPKTLVAFALHQADMQSSHRDR